MVYKELIDRRQIKLLFYNENSISFDSLLGVYYPNREPITNF